MEPIENQEKYLQNWKEIQKELEVAHFWDMFMPITSAEMRWDKREIVLQHLTEDILKAYAREKKNGTKPPIAGYFFCADMFPAVPQKDIDVLERENVLEKLVFPDEEQELLSRVEHTYTPLAEEFKLSAPVRILTTKNKPQPVAYRLSLKFLYDFIINGEIHYNSKR